MFRITRCDDKLTDSKDPAGYFKKLRQRDPELDAFVRGTNCPPPYKFISSDGKRHNPKCIDVQGLFRIVQSIPSKKAEPFKRWLAQVGADRIHQMQDPELGIQQDPDSAFQDLGRIDAQESALLLSPICRHVCASTSAGEKGYLIFSVD